LKEEGFGDIYIFPTEISTVLKRFVNFYSNRSKKMTKKRKNTLQKMTKNSVASLQQTTIEYLFSICFTG